MNILIADDLRIYRLILKSYIHKHWPDAIIYEANTMYQVVTDVFEVKFDLLILDINMPGSQLLEAFVSQAIKYTKVVIFSCLYKDDPRIDNLIKIGAEGFLSKLSQQADVISTLEFIFNQRKL